MFFSHFPLEIPSSTGSLVLGKSRPESVGTSFRAAPGLLRTAFKQQLVSWDTSQVCVRPEMFLGCFWRTQRRTAWQRHNGQTWFLVSAGVFSSLRKWSIRNPFFVAKLRAEGIRIHWLGPTARSLYFQIFWGLEHVLLAMFHHHDFRGKSVVNPHWWFYQLWSAMARPQEFSSHGWWPWRVCTWRPVSSGGPWPRFQGAEIFVKPPCPAGHFPAQNRLGCERCPAGRYSGQGAMVSTCFNPARRVLTPK